MKDIAMHEICYRTNLLKEINLHITEKCFYTDFEYIIKPLPYIQTVSVADINVYMYRIGREGQSVQLSSWFKNIDQGLKVSLNLTKYYEEIKNEKFSDKIKLYMKDAISDSVKNKYIYLSIMPGSTDNKKKLIKYDRSIRNISKEIYSNVTKIKSRKWSLIIRVQRFLNFSAYRAVNSYARRKMGL